MNYEVKIGTLEEGLETLKGLVKTRNAMGGAMYFNMLNDDCCELAGKLKTMGADYEELATIIGRSNFR